MIRVRAAPFTPTAPFVEVARVPMPDGTCLIRREVPLGNRSLDRAIREITALQELHHVNIIEHVSYEVSCGRLQVLTQGANASNLAQVIRRGLADKRPLSDEQVLQYFHQICFGVHYVHTKGFIHRDLNPDNILVFATGVVKLAGFEFCRLLPEERGGRMGVAGTYPYMAPEIFTSPYDAKVDIWSIGCIFYELCTFRRAFSSRAEEVRRAHQCRALPDMRPMKTRPRAFRDMLRRMLDYDAAKRPSARQIVRLPVIRAYFDLLIADHGSEVARGKSPQPSKAPVVGPDEGRRAQSPLPAKRQKPIFEGSSSGGLG
jgi:NIMA (never in mitosis gene a)-related kinase